jgi:hypothetical protein
MLHFFDTQLNNSKNALNQFKNRGKSICISIEIQEFISISVNNKT